MATDYSLPVRIATVAALKAAEPLAALGGRVFAKVPVGGTAWPYLRYGRPTVRPFLGTCLDGCEVEVILHVFAEGECDDECAALSASVAAFLGGKTLPLATPRPARVTWRWTGTQVLSDIAKADGWHGVVTLIGTVVA